MASPVGPCRWRVALGLGRSVRCLSLVSVDEVNGFVAYALTHEPDREPCPLCLEADMARDWLYFRSEARGAPSMMLVDAPK